MDALYLALIGIPVGLALDALIVLLGVEPDDEDGGEPEEQPAGAGLLHAERGALVLEGERAWLRRAAVVAITSALFATAAWRYAEPWQVAVVGAYIAVLVVCAGTDLLAYRVPNVVTYPAMVGALVVGALAPDTDLTAVLAGGGLAAAVLLGPSLLTGGVGMGMGDVKLVAFVGLALGFAHLVAALLFMALLGGLAALLLLVTGLRKRGEPIPYAPFISAGALAALLWQGAAFIDLV